MFAFLLFALGCHSDSQSFLNPTTRPHLNISLVPSHSSHKVKPGQTVNVKVEFNLPSDIKKLSKCILTFDGSALADPVEFKLP